MTEENPQKTAFNLSSLQKMTEESPQKTMESSSQAFNLYSLEKWTEESPFAPSRIYQRSDEEVATIKALKKERTGKCFIYVFTGLVIQSIIVLVFALIVLRVKTPNVKLSSVVVKDLKYNGTDAQTPSFSATLIAEVTINNSNYGQFKFENSSIGVEYGGVSIGDRKIGHGRAKARDTEKMNITVEVKSNRLSDTKNLSSDIKYSGMMNLSSYATLTGRVHLLKIIKKKTTTQMSCSMTLNLTSGGIQDLLCN